MSSEETWNMILSDQFLVPFAGYKRVNEIDNKGTGRGIYSSAKQNLMFAVIDNNAYMFDNDLTATIVGSLTTFVGDVFISENNAGQIAFSYGSNIYIYQPSTLTFSTAVIDFIPGYITFQNGKLISPAASTTVASNNYLWRLSASNNGLSWPTGTSLAQFQGSLQTKPDETVATIRFPGRGNMLLVFGKTVTEIWQNVGAQLFPYQRSQSINIDYGCINPATIAESEDIVAWVAINEKSGPVISYTTGGDIQHISTDGIDFRLANLLKPEDCYGFMFKQDGHLFYVATWVSDNQSYAYDFNTKKFYTLCDENLNAFIVKKVAFFQNEYYFVSIRDGNLYQLSSDFVTYDYGNDNIFAIPRIRICNSIRMPDQSRFVAAYAGFTIEQGQFDYPDVDTRFILGTEDSNEISTQNHNVLIGGGENTTANVPRVDMSVSYDGGISFSNDVSIVMFPLGVRQNRLMWWRLGSGNDMVQQFRFYGFGRFVASNGICGISQ